MHWACLCDNSKAFLTGFTHASKLVNIVYNAFKMPVLVIPHKKPLSPDLCSKCRRLSLMHTHKLKYTNVERKPQTHCRPEDDKVHAVLMRIVVFLQALVYNTVHFIKGHDFLIHTLLWCCIRVHEVAKHQTAQILLLTLSKKAKAMFLNARLRNDL